jgi:hypothetical protein
MIIDLAECKRLIRYTKDDLDAEIQTLIPFVQEDLCDHLNNYFLDPTINYVFSRGAFVAGSNDTITDADSHFLDYRFAAGMDVYVYGSGTNDGIWELSTVAAGTLTLTTSNEVVSMAYSDSYNALSWLSIARVNWPKPVKIVVARMVKHLLNRWEPDGALSENIDGVVIAWDRRGSYPREILGMADKYRRPEFV